MAACAGLVGLPDVPDIADATATTAEGVGSDAGDGREGATAEAGSTDVGDAGGQILDGAPGDGSPPSIQVDGSPDSGPQGACDGGPTVMVCGASCVDVASSVQNCRACGHDCGPGSTCDAGVCEPALLYSGPTSGFAVDGTGIYFGNSSSQIVNCPLTGCTLTPTVVANAGVPFGLADQRLSFLVPNGALSGSSAGDNLLICPESGCISANEFTADGTNSYSHVTSVITSASFFFWGHSNPGGTGLVVAAADPDGGVSVAALQTGPAARLNSFPPIPAAITASDSFVYFTANLGDAGAALYSCPSSLTGCTPTLMNAPSYTEIFAIGSDLYILPTQTGPTDQLIKCPSTGCGSSWVMSMAGNTTFFVDMTGVYWISGSNIEMCPLAGCGVAPVIVASGQSMPGTLRFWQGFVYWVNAGDSTIKRVAEPAP